MSTLNNSFSAESHIANPPRGHRPAKQTRWLQVLSHVSPQFGGIATSVPRLALATEIASSHSCPILGFCDSNELDHLSTEQRASITLLPPKRLRWVVDSQLRNRLRTTFRGASGLHIHGLWETHVVVAAELARECKLPYILSAHGMLEQWALREKRVKKALYAALVELRRLQRATCLRALSSDEVDDYRRLGLNNPIAIIPNGLDSPPMATPDLFLNKHPQLKNKRIVLYLGRLHPKKGLSLLLESWARVSSAADDVHLVIAGPDSDDTRASLERLTEQLKLKNSVTFTGMLNSSQKWSALAASSLFVLPSYSEGFSIAILEALSMGLPVIVTKQCHIPEVAAHDCGWVVPPEVGPLQQALIDFVQLSDDETFLIGRRGKEMVRRHFHSSVVGRQMAEVYDWLLGGNKPTGVEIA